MIYSHFTDSKRVLQALRLLLYTIHSDDRYSLTNLKCPLKKISYQITYYIILTIKCWSLWSKIAITVSETSLTTSWFRFAFKVFIPISRGWTDLVRSTYTNSYSYVQTQLWVRYSNTLCIIFFMYGHIQLPSYIDIPYIQTSVSLRSHLTRCLLWFQLCQLWGATENINKTFIIMRIIERNAYTKMLPTHT